MADMTIDISGEAVPTFFAVPESGSGPGLIVVQEWWGLVPHVHDLVERFAAAGFVAMAVDHYRGKQTTEPDEAGKLMMGLSIEQVAIDLAAAADVLLARDEVVGDEISVIGFCMGGGLALLAPTVSDAITKSVALYPAMPWPHYAPDWSRYAGKAAQVHLAEHDNPATAPAVAALAAEIADAGGTAQVFDYPGGVHAFFNDSRPEVYQADNAALAWTRILDFLRD
ncbi:MAG: dienelactone hydrolase family protein [bacterium]|nr:dienelactone hydrolase family protein [bacterium]